MFGEVKAVPVLLVALVLIVAGLSPTRTQADPVLAAYYPFNGNANDGSGNGRHGTVLPPPNDPSPCEDRFGNPSSAYCFDGDDYIEVSGFPSLTGDVTFSAWVSMHEPPEGGRVGGYVLNKGSYGVCEEYSITVNESRFPGVRLHVGSAYYIVESSDAIEFGDWWHIEGVYRSEEREGQQPRLELYVSLDEDHSDEDPKDYTDVPGGGNLDSNSESLYFGGDYGGPLAAWEGAIDEVRIYGSASQGTGVIPEPISMAFMGSAFVGVVACRLRKRRREKSKR